MLPATAAVAGMASSAMPHLELQPHTLRPRRKQERGMRLIACSKLEADGQHGEGPSAPAPSEDDGPGVPAVGWLWNRKAALTRDSLRRENIKPKK